MLVIAFGQVSKSAEEKFVDSRIAIAEEEGEEEEVIAEDEDSLMKDEEEDPDLKNEDDILEEEEECSRISPKEIFHTELHPRLLSILDEMSNFVEAVLSRIELSLEILLPHVQESPIGNLKVEDLFPEVRQFIFGTMRDVYDLVRISWRDLIRVHVTSRNDAKSQLEAMKKVRDAQYQGEENIRASLMELSVTIKAIVLNSIYVIQDSLKLTKETEQDQAAVFVSRSIPKIAPNFLGTLMIKVLEKGQEPEAYQKIQTNTLRYLTRPVDQMYQELENIVDGSSDDQDLQAYWKKMMDECHSRLIAEPIHESDFESIFQNEEYLRELVLGLMASF